MIPLLDMKPRGVYYCNGRNFHIGVWDGEGFFGRREKFGHIYITKEYHHESDSDFGTVIPLRYLEQLPDTIHLKDEAFCSLPDLDAYLTTMEKKHPYEH